MNIGTAALWALAGFGTYIVLKEHTNVLGDEIPLRKKFTDGTYTQTGNGAGNAKKRKELMSKAEANKLAKDYIRRGWKAKVVRCGKKYALYTHS